MASSLSDEQNAHAFRAEHSSLISILDSGLQHIQQGHYAEGTALLTQAREQLSPDQVHHFAALDTFIQGHALYWQAQQALHLASQRFAEAAASQKTHLATLHNLLAALIQEEKNTSQPSPCPVTPPSKDHRPNRGPEPVTNDLLPALSISCFGHFEVRRSGKPLALCPNRCGQSIFRFLVARPQHYATSDTLLSLLWPEDHLEAALNKLHIAISALRRSLNHGYSCEPGCGYILCKNRTYALNPAVAIHTDVDEFLHYFQAGQQAKEERIALHEKACRLYTGPFLSEELYADWSVPQREDLNRIYLIMCKGLAEYYLQHKHYDEAIQWTTTILKENRCDEAAHRQLMQIYAAQGRRSEALQQYQRCKLVLREELGVLPLPETTQLFQTFLANDPGPTQ